MEGMGLVRRASADNASRWVLIHRYSLPASLQSSLSEGHGGHAKASWESQCLFGGWRGDQSTDAGGYHCPTEAATLNWKHYTDRTQEMSVPTHVEDHVASPRCGTRKHGRLLGSICTADAVNSAPKNHAQCDSSRVDPVNVFIFSQTTVAGRAVSSRISCAQDCRRRQVVHVSNIAVFLNPSSSMMLKSRPAGSARFSFGTACLPHLGHSRQCSYKKNMLLASALAISPTASE